MKPQYNRNPKSEAYTKYIELLQQGGSMPYLDEEDWEDIVYDFNDDRNIESAHYALAEGLRQHPDSIILKKIHVLLLIEEKRIAEATEELKPYLNDGTFETMRLLFALQVAQGKAKAALKQLVGYLQDGKIYPLEFTDTINDYWDEINDEESIQKTALFALEVIKDDAEAFVELGIILADTNDFPHAAQSQEKALDIDAYNMKAWHNVIRCYFEMAEYERCQECCDLALAVDDYSPILHFARAYCYVQSEQWQEALDDLIIVRRHIDEMRVKGSLLEEYATLEDVDSQLATTLDTMGQCYQNLGRIPEAIEAFSALLERLPKDHELCFNLACLTMDMGDANRSIEYIDRAIRLCPRKSAYHSLRVSILTATHRFDEALIELDKLIRLSPRSTSYLLAKAELSLHLGNRDEADTTCRQLLRLHPKDDVSRKFLRDYFSGIGDNEALNEI